MPTPSAVLFLDPGSPVVSVAVGTDGAVLARRTIELRRSSEHLLGAAREVLEEAGLERRDLSGVVALQGPGSFTGLRIGLATAQGLHQALGIRATALPTLPVLAAAAGAREDDPAGDVVAAVDAIRGDWTVQRFRVTAGRGGAGGAAVAALGEAELLPARALLDRAPCRVVGFGITRLSAEPWWREPGIELVEPPPLAPVAAEHLAGLEIDWDPSRLTSPIYFRPPAVTPPKARNRPADALPADAASAMIQKSR